MIHLQMDRYIIDQTALLHRYTNLSLSTSLTHGLQRFMINRQCRFEILDF